MRELAGTVSHPDLARYRVHSHCSSARGPEQGPLRTCDSDARRRAERPLDEAAARRRAAAMGRADTTTTTTTTTTVAVIAKCGNTVLQKPVRHCIILITAYDVVIRTLRIISLPMSYVRYRRFWSALVGGYKHTLCYF